MIESTQHPGLDREHPGLGAASARRHRAFLRPRGRHGGGERRRLWRVELGAGRRGVGGVAVPFFVVGDQGGRVACSGVVRVISCVQLCIARITGLP